MQRRSVKMAKGIIPNDFRDFLSILSAIGFLGIFSQFILKSNIISENSTPLFLIIGGAGLMVLGKVFQIKAWLRDGLQQNEYLMLFASIFGISSVVIGILMWANITLPLEVTTLAGWLALFPLATIVMDYFAKNI